MKNETKCPLCGMESGAYCGKLPCGSILYEDGSIGQSPSCATIQALKKENEELKEQIRLMAHGRYSQNVGVRIVPPTYATKAES